MRIVDFSRDHVAEAALLALAMYEEERRCVPTLPPVGAMPDLAYFADNGMGVAAFNDEVMLGFMCCYKPYKNAFGSSAKGIFSPMGAHAAVLSNRARIYAAMYEAAAEKWVRTGAISHCVSLYAHDKVANEQFFRYGFGLRCVDAIRPMELIDCAPCQGYEFMELTPNEYMLVYPLNLMLNEYQRSSPYFMNSKPGTPESFMEYCNKKRPRFFGAKHENELCAYLQITDTGETFISEQPDCSNITGAFCLPQHRGKGMYQNLINAAITKLKDEGFTKLGVDFESFNPSGAAFWLKHFTAYVHGVVRRIDENILDVFMENE